MPRPKTHSDDEVLDAALAALLEKGPAAFTLADVAKGVGLSRAAVIQRFGDKASLHRKVAERLTQQVVDYFECTPFGPGLGPLWEMLKDLIAGMGGGDGTEGYLLMMWAEVRDPGLRELAARRNALVRRAIADRVPSGPHDAEATAALVQAVLQGACMQWLVEPQGLLADLMTRRTAQLMEVLYPGHRFD